MAMSDLQFGRTESGEPRAQPTAARHGADVAVLARFLTEEVRWPHYVDLLLDYAERAANGTPDTATGNAYGVSFDGQTARIEHLFLLDQPVAEIPSDVFAETLRAWRMHLLALSAPE